MPNLKDLVSVTYMLVWYPMAEKMDIISMDGDRVKLSRLRTGGTVTIKSEDVDDNLEITYQQKR